MWSVCRRRGASANTADSTKTRIDRIAELLLSALNDEEVEESPHCEAPQKRAVRSRKRRAKRVTMAHVPEVTVRGDGFHATDESRPWLEGTAPRDLVLSERETRWLEELPLDARGPLREGVMVGRGGMDRLGWTALRTYVLERDRGRCFVCRMPIGEGEYECGHIIDRMVGGPDRASNLVAMHTTCNRLKGVHESRQEFVVWMTEFRELVARMVRPSSMRATIGAGP